MRRRGAGTASAYSCDRAERQARADGVLVSLDGTSLYHERAPRGDLSGHPAAGTGPVAGHLVGAGRSRDRMAEIAGISRDDIRAWSRRSSQLREWAAHNLVSVDGRSARRSSRRRRKRRVRPSRRSWRGANFRSSGALTRAGLGWTAPGLRKRARRAALPRLPR